MVKRKIPKTITVTLPTDAAYSAIRWLCAWESHVSGNESDYAEYGTTNQLDKMGREVDIVEAEIYKALIKAGFYD